MKSYKGIVVQSCYIPVTIEVDDDTPMEDVEQQMLNSAETDDGEWDSEVYDIFETTGLK